MVDLLYFPADLLFFDIPLLDCYINLRSICKCSVFPCWVTYILFSVSVSRSSVSELLCGEVLEIFVVILSEILLIHFSQLTRRFCRFLNCFFWASFKCICGRLFSMIKKFVDVFTAEFSTYIFAIFLAKDRNP